MKKTQGKVQDGNVRNFMQIGFTALRDPGTGGFLKPLPLYIEADPAAEDAERAMVNDIAEVFAENMRRYVEGGGVIAGPPATSNKKKG